MVGGQLTLNLLRKLLTNRTGLATPGLFRVEGNRVATEALYDYYQRQLGTSNGDTIVQTTSLATLPTHLTYTVNDVAHLFKALLAGLPGGLLGSPAVFHSIQSFLHTGPSLNPHLAKRVRPRMIALAIASLNLHFRITLICAVFGLLRCVALSTHGVVEEPKITDHAETFTYLREDSLGVVFGPLLLGDKSDQILVPAHEEREGLSLLPTISPQSNEEPSKGKFKRKKNLGYVQLQREKAKRAALVTEMMISEWENIVTEMRKIGVMEETRRSYDILGLSSRAILKTEDVERDMKPQTKGLLRSTEMGDGKLKERKSWKVESSGSRERFRSSSRISSQHGLRDNRTTSGLPPKSANHLHLSNSKSMSHMKDSLHRTESKTGDLYFLGGSRHHKFSRASDMNSALHPATIFINRQEVDLMETERPVVLTNREVLSSALEGLSSLDTGRGFEEEKLVQSLQERENFSAQDILAEVKPPIVLMGSGKGGSGESAWVIEGSSSNGPTNTGNGATNMVADKSNSGGNILNPSTFVHPSLSNIVISASKTVEPGGVPEDVDLRPIWKVNHAQPTVRHQEGRYMSLDATSIEDNTECAMGGTIGKAGDKRGPGVMKPQLGLRVAKRQEGQHITREPEGTLALESTLTTPCGIGVEISVGGELEMINGGESTETLQELEPLTTEEKQPIDDTTPQPLGSIPLEVVKEVSPPSQPQPIQVSTPLSRAVSVSYPYPTTSSSPTAQSPTLSMNVLPLEVRSNSALYNEICMLRALLEIKMQEVDQMKKELELVRSMVTSESIGTLGQLLREAREEGKLWRNRAEWAEKRVKELMGQGQPQLDSIGDAARVIGGEILYDRDNRQVEGTAAGLKGEKDGDWGRGWYNTFGIGRGRGFSRGGRGKMVPGEVAQRVGSWGVRLQETGPRKGEAGAGSRAISAEVSRVSDTVGPRGPLRLSPPPSRTLQAWGARGRWAERERRGH